MAAVPAFAGAAAFLLSHFCSCSFPFVFRLLTLNNTHCCVIPLLRSREYDEGSFRRCAGDHARRARMKRTFTICGAILLAAITAAAPFEASLAARGKQGEQEKPAAPTHDMEHMHHGGFMQGGHAPCGRQGREAGCESG